MTEVKPLQPITSGVVVLAGVKASNFDDEIRTHPQVVLWDSQNESWHGKELPVNTRAVFTSRWISHAAFAHILKDARKRRIVLFSTEGTGQIARQVKELLNISKPAEKTVTEYTVTLPTTVKEVEEMTMPAKKKHIQGKLIPLHQYADFSVGNYESARKMMVKAKELGIETTVQSLAQLMTKLRREFDGSSLRPRASKKAVETRGLDVSVEILDNVIQELKDMRQFLIDTTRENKALKAKMETFRKMFEV